MSGPEGWDGKSLKTHVEDAYHLASDAMNLAQALCDEVETLKTDFVTGPVSEAKAKVLRRSFEAIGQLAHLGLGYEKVRGQKTPVDAAFHCDEIGMAINVHCKVALDFLDKEEGDGNE